MRITLGMTKNKKLGCYILVNDKRIEIWKEKACDFTFSQFFGHKKAKKSLDFFKQLEKEVKKI